MGWNEYAAAWAVQHGGYDARRAPAPVRVWLLAGYAVARVLRFLRVPAGAVTLAALAAALAVPFVSFRGTGGLLAAAALVALSVLAGTVARALGVMSAQASPRSMIREALADRLSELAWLIGFWAAGASAPVVLAAGIVTGLHEYLRAQALVAGMSRIGAQTAGERPARASVAVTGLILAGLVGLTGLGGGDFGRGLLTVVAAAWLLVAMIGFGQLGSAVNRSLR